MEYKAFENKIELSTKFCAEVSNLLKLALEERKEAYLVVSGGKAPKEYLSCLSKMPLNWKKITILLADERCVDISQPDSNENFIRYHLLQNEAAEARFISFMDQGDQEAHLHEEMLNKKIKALPLFDVVVLGMGEDGHTASLFPRSPQIEKGLSAENTDAVIATDPMTAPYQRLTLTKTRLLKCHHLFLYLIGEEKRKVLDKALAGDDPQEMPIRAFLKSDYPEMKIRFAPDLP